MTARVAGVLMLVAVLVTACHTPAASRGRIVPLAIPSFTWKDCGYGFQCSSLAVPLDYANPQAGRISLAVIRKRATDQRGRLGAVLLNPGGPGGSGVDFLRGGAGWFSGLNRRFDLVSWDPRGVGASGGIKCADDGQMGRLLALDPVLDDPQEKQTYIDAVQQFAAGCELRSPRLLSFVDSASTARDMDRIRQALDEPKLTYLGFSYGTYLGQWYAHLYPNRVRALALDGVVDPAVLQNQMWLAEAFGFQQSLDGLFENCKADPTCFYTRQGRAEERLMATLDSLDRAPMRIGDRQLTRGMVLTAIASLLYDPSNWTYIDEALTALDYGDGRLLLQLADGAEGRNSGGSYSDSVKGVRDAIYCLDSGASASIAPYDARGTAAVEASPIFGPFLQYGDLVCAFWPVKGKHVNESLTIAGTPPILLVGATGDPATPYPEAETVAKEIPSSVLLTHDGWGHTSYIYSNCVQEHVDNFLLNLSLPAAGTVCSD